MLLTLLALALPALVSQPVASTSSDAPCPDLHRLAGVGLVCRRSSGLYEVFDAAGRSLGFTHGPDPACGVDCADAPRLATADASGAVRCVEGLAGDHYVRAIYARASNDIDRYATMAPRIRALAQDSAQMIDDAAVATNDRLSLKLLCANGEISVDNVVLPTPVANADFSTIVADLRAKGYLDIRQKYWVFYDDATSCPCLGVAHIYYDERNVVDNANNAGPGTEPMFAVIFNSEGVRPMLHELAHTLGAVQHGAPASTLAGHCFDGRDTMCYNDGGPRGGLYTVTTCTVEVFDCKKNTYCNAYPPAGSWLASNWQVCSRLSRYLVYPPNEAPTMTSLVCAPAPSYPEEEVTCSFTASDPAPGVHYVIDWGDGTVARVPASGTVAPGTIVSAKHVYLAQSDRTVSVHATDVGHPPLTSAPISIPHLVMPPNQAPLVSGIECSPAAPREDEPLTCAFTSSDEHNVSFTIDWGDGSPLQRAPPQGTVTAQTSATASHFFPYGGAYTIQAFATDDGRPPRSGPKASHEVSITDMNVAPVMQHLACSTVRAKPGVPVTCEFRASDDSRNVFYRVAWGDGTTVDVGLGSPGVVRTAEHVYTEEEQLMVSVVAIDDGDPVLASPPRTLAMRVVEDQTLPVMDVWFPEPGGIYQGCEELARTGFNVTPVYLRRGCVKVAASDEGGSQMKQVEVRYHGVAIANDLFFPYVIEFPLPRFENNLVITVRAIDNAGNARSFTFEAHAFNG